MSTEEIYNDRATSDFYLQTPRDQSYTIVISMHPLIFNINNYYRLKYMLKTNKGRLKEDYFCVY
jgi:hypothetical protein